MNAIEEAILLERDYQEKRLNLSLKIDGFIKPLLLEWHRLKTNKQFEEADKIREELKLNSFTRIEVLKDYNGKYSDIRAYTEHLLLDKILPYGNVYTHIK